MSRCWALVILDLNPSSRRQGARTIWRLGSFQDHQEGEEEAHHLWIFKRGVVSPIDPMISPFKNSPSLFPIAQLHSQCSFHVLLLSYQLYCGGLSSDLDPHEIAMQNRVTNDGCPRCLTHSSPGDWALSSLDNAPPCPTARLPFLCPCFAAQPLYQPVRAQGRSKFHRAPTLHDRGFFARRSHPFGTHYCPHVTSQLRAHCHAAKKPPIDVTEWWTPTVLVTQVSDQRSWLCQEIFL
ncbi:hypothetical protein HD554DRAFT_1670274 [Boletus coccyginus]|nr:hypothetical protein HD554DRAFT_1670274 [Boletus coccyginus]